MCMTRCPAYQYRLCLPSSCSTVHSIHTHTLCAHAEASYHAFPVILRSLGRSRQVKRQRFMQARPKSLDQFRRGSLRFSQAYCLRPRSSKSELTSFRTPKKRTNPPHSNCIPGPHPKASDCEANGPEIRSCWWVDFSLATKAAIGGQETKCWEWHGAEYNVITESCRKTY